jgi:inhibitor of KinA sporulation pathway (predicted exonuclease)
MKAISAPYECALYLDLEWTCWDGPRADGRSPEIIEIGVAETDLQSLDIRREAAYLVRPKHIEISLRCTQLTGISASDLKTAQRFPEVLQQFEADFHPREQICYTWGNDTDIFANSCRTHRLRSPFRNVVDLSRFFQHAFLLSNQPSLRSAIDLLELPFDGVVHTALADARNTARVHLALLRQFRRKPDPIPEGPISPAKSDNSPTLFGQKLLASLSVSNRAIGERKGILATE